MQTFRSGLSCLAVIAAVAAFTIAAPIRSASAACNDEWKPVCGVKDGFKHTYSNACWAKAAGAKHIKPGACKW
jgi:Kazal-type serine protease inhibitor domain